MHELYCPSCNTPSQFDLTDYMLLCPFCSASFNVDLETGQKNVYGDHYIVPNTVDPGTVKELTLEWLRRIHHKPGAVEREYYVVDIQGISVPYWIVSLEGHTHWSGLIQRVHKSNLHVKPGSEFLYESGQFRRSYRWAVTARSNICEFWGMTRLHEPQENINVEWDGFPLDSTFSRGRLTDEGHDRSAYDVREFFEFKFSNGLPIMGVQVSEEEALRRACNHVELYHYKLACTNVDYLIDHRTELEIAGIQLIHLPFWNARYVYRPKTSLKYFYKPKEKNIVLDGFNKGVLKSELALGHIDKVTVNAYVCGGGALIFLLLGSAWHPAFYIVSFLAAGVSAVSGFLAMTRRAKQKEEALKERNNSIVAMEGAGNRNTGTAPKPA